MKAKKEKTHFDAAQEIKPEVEQNKTLWEVLKEVYLDDRFILNSPNKIYRYHYKGSRYYMVFNGKTFKTVPSVTTILKLLPMAPGLLKWYCALGYEEARQTMQERADYGTFMHIIFERLMLKESIDLGEGLEDIILEFLKSIDRKEPVDLERWKADIKQDIIGFIRFFNDYQVKPIAIEYPVFTNKYAGVVDLVAEITRAEGRGANKKEIKELALIDFKSGRKGTYDSYPLQLYAYKEAWNKEWPEYKVNRVYNYQAKEYRLPIGKTVTPYTLTDQTEKADKKKWEAYLKLFYMDPANFNFKPETEIKGESINLESDIDKFIVTEDRLKNIQKEIKSYNKKQGKK